MSTDPSVAVDVWRLVSAGRVLEGEVPLSAFGRLRDALASDEGVVRYRIIFGHDRLAGAHAEVQADAGLPLVCQRSLQPFVLPVEVRQYLGLVRDEDQEAALQPGFEAWLVPEDGRVVPLEMIEDELILAVPVVALNPESEAVEADWPATEEETSAASPFAALAALKKPD